jgi:ribonuclease HI
MFNQTSISDFFPKKNPDNNNNSNSDNNSVNLHLSDNNSLKRFFPSNKFEINMDEKSEEENSKCNKQFKNIFSDEGVIERVEVFTDGSTINNGKKNASGGVGVFFYDDSFKNISERYNSNNVTNQKCEILAIIKGLQVIKSKFGRHSKKINILIHTDSEYCIKCMNSYIKNWIRNNWKLRNGNNVKNRNLLELLLNLSNEFNNISYNHIRSHKQEPINKESLEYKLWYGNMMADKLANEGRSKSLFIDRKK